MKFRLAGLFVGIAVLLGTGLCFCRAQETSDQPADIGELKLEGKNIQRLVLQRKNGRQETFRQPGESISLPSGEYQLYEIRLQGGYTCYAWRESGAPSITVTSDKPAVLKIGAPLRQTIKVERQGSVLVLNYQLLGIGGESYASSDRGKPPTFTVYKGDKEIASGKFEFG